MNRHLLVETKVAPGLLFELACRIGHVQSTTPVANWQTVQQDVFAKPDRHLRIERLHKAIAKYVSRNHVRVSRAKDQVAVCVNSGPVERHEAALVAKRVEIVGEPLFKVLPAQMAWA